MPSWRLGIALAVLLAAGTANAERSAWDHNEIGLAQVASWLRDVERGIWINSDPIMRAIVCRVPYGNFTPKTISMATNLSPQRIMLAIAELEAWGLIYIVGTERWEGLIVPASGKTREKLRGWSQGWCISDDSCEISR